MEGGFRLPDPDDEHVSAAALVGGPGAIVTANLKEFPAQRIPAPIKVVSPAQFAADTVAVSPDVARRTVRTMAARFSAPPLTVDEILDRLIETYRMIEAVDIIRTAN